MKIYKLKILDKNEKIIRDIKFNLEGISFIFGEIAQKTGTINSLGKSILMKLIDYIYGANEDSQVVQEDIHGYWIEAEVIYEGDRYIVKRELGASSNITIDNDLISLDDYKKFFNIKRDIFKKQIILEKRKNIISINSKPYKNDVLAVINLLNLTTLLENLEAIYSIQDEIKTLKKLKDENVKMLKYEDKEKIENKIFILNKEIENFQKKILDISKKIKTLEISNLTENVIKEYSLKKNELKNIFKDLNKDFLEKERLVKFLQETNKIDISNKNISLLFEKANYEVPILVKKNLEEVENFHKKIFEEKKEFFHKKIEILEKNINFLKEKSKELEKDVDSIGRIISENELYKETIEIYEKYNSDLNKKIFEKGKLDQIEKILNEIQDLDASLGQKYSDIQKEIKNYSLQIKDMKDFIYDTTKYIYDYDDDEHISLLDINIRKKHQTRRPLEIEVKIKGDGSEGVGEVKNILVDLLILNVNKSLDFLFLDSSCFSGVDPRQVIKLLEIIENIANQNKKQVIISLNKYQITSEDKELNDKIKIFVEKKLSIRLSEKDKLFKFDFLMKI